VILFHYSNDFSIQVALGYSIIRSSKNYLQVRDKKYPITISSEGYDTRGSVLNQKGLLTAWNDAKGFGFITPRIWAAAAVVLAVLANLGAVGWLLLAPEAMSWRQQLGFDLSKSLRPLVWSPK
jgi:hypothetical protein